MSVVSVYAVFADAEEAERIGRQIVEERLAACVNIISPVRSIYRWEGKVEASDEAKAKCPTDLVCNCQSSSLVEIPLGFNCDGGTQLSEVGTGIGVTTSPSSPLMRPGCPAAECAYVRLTTATYANATDPVGATCCKD